MAFNRSHPILPTRATLTGRTAIERRRVHIPDVLADPEYDCPDALRLGGFRAMLGVPMLRDDEVVGVIDLWRREITVVFGDLRGFTAFSETAAPEDVLAVFRTYHAALGVHVAEHGGMLERFTGDGLMIFFNDPVERPAHVERAVRMAVAMRSDVARLTGTGEWRRSGFALGFGVGIATRYATPGRIGFRGRVDYSAIGSVVNLAARLCAEAADGAILLAPRSHAAVQSLIETRTAGGSPKGFSRPVVTVDVIGLKNGPGRQAAGRLRPGAPPPRGHPRRPRPVVRRRR